MAISLDAAAATMRDAMRQTVRRYSLWYLVQGMLMVVTGVLALIYPWIASVAMVRLLGWFLIVSGVLQAIGLIGAREVPYFWLELISAILPIVLGLLLLRHEDVSLYFFSIVVIVYFMIEGIVKILFALTIRPFPSWGWVFFSGVIGIALSIYLWANLSIVSALMLAVLLGVLLVVEGAALASLAWRARKLTDVKQSH
ncbi:MAG: HdeD family acid-resistance protein [Methyloceanibacter sp.]|jgi:uncharacterized membrane protein HdeD (DUF308 family)